MRLVFLLLLGLAACNQIPSDRVYALRLDAPPTAADWQRAPVHTLRVGGGRPHKVELFPDLDQDTVHTSTASCHHGAQLPEPIDVEMRAFYTERDLYLQLSWPDPTPDRAMRQWHYDGETWQAGGGLEDGFGILWADPRQFLQFSCARACHLEDFGVQGARFQAHSRMKLATPQGRLDLWHWKAERTGRYGFADDRYLDSEGMHGDLPGELFQENSRAALENLAALTPFGEGDAPLYDRSGEPLGKGFMPAGSKAPGYLTEVPQGDRADVRAAGHHADGRWTVVLRRALETGSPRDISFAPGGEVAFGLAIMDNTLSDHYASKLTETLVLLPPEP